jgi:hypothetical protein
MTNQALSGCESCAPVLLLSPVLNLSQAFSKIQVVIFKVLSISFYFCPIFGVSLFLRLFRFALEFGLVAQIDAGPKFD